MAEESDRPLHVLDEEAALRTILEGTATATGQQFFAALVQNLAKALNTPRRVGDGIPGTSRRLRALAFWMDGSWVHDYEIDITRTPCEQVIETSRLVQFPDNLLALYPHDPDIKETAPSVIWERRFSMWTERSWGIWR